MEKIIKYITVSNNNSKEIILGKNINNSENRFNNARTKMMKLMGEQVTVSMKNNRSQIANIPKEGDIGLYYIT
jgi:GTPase Era involved in 16S rRNA processing